jgi:hypothetical protein
MYGAGEELRRLYVEDGLSLSALAEHYGCSVTTVWRRLVAAGIPRRPATSGPRHERHEFSGGPAEKAYLVPCQPSFDEWLGVRMAGPWYLRSQSATIGSVRRPAIGPTGGWSALAWKRSALRRRRGEPVRLARSAAGGPNSTTGRISL